MTVKIGGVSGSLIHRPILAMMGFPRAKEPHWHTLDRPHYYYFFCCKKKKKKEKGNFDSTYLL